MTTEQPSQPRRCPSCESAEARAIVERLCTLTDIVHSVVGFDHPNDCFCGIGGFWDREEYGPDGFRHDLATVEFIEAAVREKIEREAEAEVGGRKVFPSRLRVAPEGLIDEEHGRQYAPLRNPAAVDAGTLLRAIESLSRPGYPDENPTEILAEIHALVTAAMGQEAGAASEGGAHGMRIGWWAGRCCEPMADDGLCYREQGHEGEHWSHKEPVAPVNVVSPRRSSAEGEQ